MPAKCKRRVKVDDVKVVEEYDLDLGPAQRTAALEKAAYLAIRPDLARSIRYWVGWWSTAQEIRERNAPIAVAELAAEVRRGWTDKDEVLVRPPCNEDSPVDDASGIRVVPSRYQPER